MDNMEIPMSDGGIDRNYILKAIILALVIVSLMCGMFYIFILAPEGGCDNISPMWWGNERANFCYNVVQISVYSAVIAALIAIWMVPTSHRET